MPLSPEQIAEFDKITGSKTPTATSSPVNNDTSEIDAAISTGTKTAKDNGSTNADKATFKAPVDQQINGIGDVAGIAARTVSNIPSSAWKFAKGTVMFPVEVTKNAIEAGKQMIQAGKDNIPLGDIAKEIPYEVAHQTYQTLVPQFLQNIFKGDLGKASATVQNDPVGQILPLLLVAKQGAEAMGKGDQFESAMSKLADPVTKAGESLKTAAGQIVSQTLGAGTGTGASTVSEAYKASKAGGDTANAFKEAMRGNTSPEDVVKSAHDIVGNIKENRGNAYVEQLKTLGEDTKSHDISPVHTALDTQLQKFGVKEGKDGQLDFSRSSIANNGSARADIQGVYDTLKSWGTKSGDRTGVGLDILKKQLGDFYSPSSQARAFVQGVKSPLVDLLNKEVPGYKDMTAGYSKVSNFLDEIKSATGAGSNAKPDTVFTKLTSAMKGDKEFRLQIMDEMTKTDPTFMAKVAGTNMASWIPKGLVGKGIDVSAGLGALAHVFNPSIIPVLLGTSPRVIGEFARAMGIGAGQIEPILKAINTFKVPAALADKGGLSIQNIAKGITPESVGSKFDSMDINLVDNYLKNPQDTNAYMKIQSILEGAKLDKADPTLVDRFLKEAVDLAKQKKK